jgi:hypothetical protein
MLFSAAEFLSTVYLLVFLPSFLPAASVRNCQERAGFAPTAQTGGFKPFFLILLHTRFLDAEIKIQHSNLT